MNSGMIGGLAALLVATSASAFAADPAPVPAPQAAPAPTQATSGKPNPGDRIVCEEDAETGSLIAKKKTCMTVSQWRDKAFRSGQWIEHQTTYNSSPNGR